MTRCEDYYNYSVASEKYRSQIANQIWVVFDEIVN